ncbi:hypothetical protein D083_0477 [Dickeya solani RNS 08.23.3.1.A]|nr:hypothetical protein D083_0477 [Dickeya solani RNS 08.23.3.1.A]
MVIMTLTAVRKRNNRHVNSLICSGEPHESPRAKDNCV